jgi:Cu2+-exporting ATPase
MSIAVDGGRTRDLSLFVRRSDSGTEAMDLAVAGIKCAVCMSTIERGLGSEPGVVNARVNLAAKRLTVEWKPAVTSPLRIMERMEEIGFTAHPFSPQKLESEEAREEKRLLRALGVAAFGAMNIMLLSVSVWSGNLSGITSETRDFFHWMSALIALPIAAYSGRPFYESALKAIRARAVNMDVPITLGILLALIMSVVETLQHAEHAYFDSAVMLIFFLLIGRYLDQASRRKTRDVATNIAALRSDVATRLLPDGSMVDTPVEAIAPGDLVVAAPGQRIAVDGVVETGTSEIDQSLVTGETRYVPVVAGSPVYAGTLNISGQLRIRVTKAESGTLLAEIERLLNSAVEGRAAYVRLADRAARLYAPVVHATAALTFLGWLLAGLAWKPALLIAITVLIITCPCALALAIPAVQVVATQALFRRSVLIHAADALERLSEVDTVVFDKTGTLTLPEPSLANRADLSDVVLAQAGALAMASRHPLAMAVAAAAGRPPVAGDMTETPGAGVSGVIDGVEARLGSLSFCKAEAAGVTVAARYPDASLIAYRRGDEVHVFAVEQALRKDARETVDALHTAGFRTAILSGDRGDTVRRVAERLGIRHWQGDLKPADKIAALEARALEGQRVLMVGDGLNDAPSLAAAHVSLSPVTAVHLAQASADGVFLGDFLRPVLDSVTIARRARRIMGENLALAVVYNMIAVPLAIAGYVTPLVAALAMSGSSIIVSLNALRAGKSSAHGSVDKPVPQPNPSLGTKGQPT